MLAPLNIIEAGPSVNWGSIGWATRVTDLTDLTCANSGNRTNIGSTVNLTIPTDGLLVLYPISFNLDVVSGSGAWFFASLGVTINSINHDFEQTTAQGTGMSFVGLSPAQVWKNAVLNHSVSTAEGNPGLMALDIVTTGMATGSQNIQLYFTNSGTGFVGTARLRDTIIGVEVISYV